MKTMSGTGIATALGALAVALLLFGSSGSLTPTTEQVSRADLDQPETSPVDLEEIDPIIAEEEPTAGETFVIEIPEDHFVTSANITVSTPASAPYPLNPQLDLGQDGNVDWDFPAALGAFGMQNLWTNGNPVESMEFNSSNDNDSVAFAVPAGARLTGASMEVIGDRESVTWVPSNEITALASTHGMIYIGVSDLGVVRYNLTTADFEPTWTTQNGLPDDEVTVLEVGENALYIGTVEGGAVRVDLLSGLFGSYWDTRSGMPENHITAVTEHDGVVYLGMAHQGLRSYSISEFRYLESWSPADLVSGQIRDLEVLEDELFVAHPWSGITRIDTNESMVLGAIDTNNLLWSDAVTDLESFGLMLYIATDGGGVSSWIPSLDIAGPHWNSSTGLVSDHVEQILVNSRDLYIAGRGEGIQTLDLLDYEFGPTQFHHSAPDRVTALVSVPGGVHVGTREEGVLTIDLGFSIPLLHWADFADMAPTVVSHAFAPWGDDLLLGGEDGIWTYDGVQGRFDSHQLDSYHVTCIAPGADRIFAGTDREGIVVSDITTDVLRFISVTGQSLGILDLVQHESTLFALTPVGLSEIALTWNPSEISHYSGLGGSALHVDNETLYWANDEGILRLDLNGSFWMDPIDEVATALATHEGILYIGTDDSGVLRYDTIAEQQLAPWELANGLPSNEVRDMILVNGSLLVSTAAGVVELSPQGPATAFWSVEADEMTLFNDVIYLAVENGIERIGVHDREILGPETFVERLSVELDLGQDGESEFILDRGLDPIHHPLIVQGSELTAPLQKAVSSGPHVVRSGVDLIEVPIGVHSNRDGPVHLGDLSIEYQMSFTLDVAEALNDSLGNHTITDGMVQVPVTFGAYGAGTVRISDITVSTEAMAEEIEVEDPISGPGTGAGIEASDDDEISPTGWSILDLVLVFAVLIGAVVVPILRLRFQKDDGDGSDELELSTSRRTEITSSPAFYWCGVCETWHPDAHTCQVEGDGEPMVEGPAPRLTRIYLPDEVHGEGVKSVAGTPVLDILHDLA